MKNIFQQIFSTSKSKKANEISAWLNDLSEMDDLTALKFSTKQLALGLIEAQSLTETQTNTQGVLNRQEALYISQQVDLIMAIEEANITRLQKLSQQFVSVENMKPDLENNIAETCYNYCRQSYICHLKVIEKVIDPKKFTLAENMPALLIARTLYVAFNMVKWRLFNQASTPTKVWLQIYTLYNIAQQQALLNTPVELFKYAPNTSLSAHFVQVCMLGQLGQTSLQKYAIEMAAQILNNWLTHTYISNQYTPEQYLFYIDLEKDAPAKRMRQFEPNDYCRYWEIDALEKQLSVAITVTDRGEISQNLMFLKSDNAKKLNTFLKDLYAEWNKNNYTRQRRKESRSATSKTAKVNAGIVNISNQVHEANRISSGLRLSRDGKSFDDRLKAHTVLIQPSNVVSHSGSLDTWIITDESSHGLGARVNKYANILARPDKLIGLMMDEDPSKVIIGMIRAAKPTHGNQLKVGVEIVSHHPAWVQIRQMREDELFSNTQSGDNAKADANARYKPNSLEMDYFSGIYLPIEAGLSDTSAVLLPKMYFRANTYYSVNIAGRAQRALLGEPVESRDDWVKVIFPF